MSLSTDPLVLSTQRRLEELVIRLTQRIQALESVLGTAGRATPNMQISPLTNDVRLGPTGATTGMTGGYVFIPAVAGPPTGVPTAQTGFVPIIYDSTNDKIYVYRGAWLKTAALT